MEALAKRYVDLWQEQLAQISADPSITEAWQGVFETTAKNVGLSPDAFTAYTAAFTGAAQGAASGATPAAAAHGDGGADVADVLRRLDAMERRLAAFEANKTGD